MKLFLTGATGYIGHRIALAAASRQYVVHALVRNPNSVHAPQHDNILLMKGDIMDRLSVNIAMKGCDMAIHAAGIARLWSKAPAQFYSVNVEGTRIVLQAGLQANIKKLVYTSSCAVMGPSFRHPISESDPRVTSFENDYEISKHWAEELIREYNAQGLPSLIVAPSRVFGPGNMTPGNPITRHISKVMHRQIAIMPRQKEIMGNYAFVDDVAAGHLLAIEKGLPGEKYILGGENISYAGFFRAIREISGKKILLVPVSTTLLKSWAAFHLGFCKLANRETHINAKVIDRLLLNREVSSAKAICHLGYSITPFREAMRYTLEHLNSSK